MLDGSWLMAQGSWLMAHGSWRPILFFVGRSRGLHGKLFENRKEKKMVKNEHRFFGGGKYFRKICW
jgi:hypothetical protein